MVFSGGGAAAVFGPDGYRLTDPIDEHSDGLAIAEADLGMIEGAKVFADPAGHYYRPRCGTSRAGGLCRTGCRQPARRGAGAQDR